MSEHPVTKSESREGELAVDEGFRRWYESCPCCLGESYPEVKAKIAAERTTPRESEKR